MIRSKIMQKKKANSVYFRATFKHFPLFLLHLNLIAQIDKKPKDEKTCLLWTLSSEEGWSGFPHAEKK